MGKYPFSQAHDVSLPTMGKKNLVKLRIISRTSFPLTAIFVIPSFFCLHGTYMTALPCGDG